MNEELISSVEDLGLSEKEARVYIACLTLGPAPVQKIAEQSGIKRVTTYVILEALSGLGLVSQSTKAKKTLFIPEDPTALRRLLVKKEQSLKEQKSSFEEILPKLQLLEFLPTDSPTVQFYDSPEGIRNVMSTFYERHKGIDMVYGMTNLDQLFEFFPEISQESSNPERTKARISSRIIYTTKKGPILRDSDSERNRISRYVPIDKYPFSADISIVGNFIVMMTLSGSKPIAVTIESVLLAQSLTAAFNLAWVGAEPYNDSSSKN